MGAQTFDPWFMTDEDRNLAYEYLGDWLLKPDVVLAPDGEPYLYRWHIIYDNQRGNEFFHIQVKSDPERPFHDHPWPNASKIIAGGYDELYYEAPELVTWRYEGHELLKTPSPAIRQLRKGDKVERAATTAHRLILPSDIPYTMTRFSTGPKTREWGFWYPDGWHHNKRHVDDRPTGISYGKHE
jgi:hypothetical protein